MTTCTTCTNPTANGWHTQDEITLTYEGLKKAQNEAIIQGVTYAMDYLEDINYHDGANAVSEFLEILTGQTILREGYWQEQFHKTHALYLENCQNFSNGTSAARESDTFENGVKWAIQALKGEEFTEHSAILASLYNTKAGN